ncbi:MAG: YitT family protein [Anaerolineaceae bacterium]|nr:YitT family protein [Anaerolineaceae bacterium]
MSNQERSEQKNQHWFYFAKPSWRSIQDYAFVLLGSFVQALAMRLFLVPSLLISGGVSGAAQLINYYNNWPIGVMVFLGNLPLFLLGWRYLGGRRFAMRTMLSILTFSIFTDLLVYLIPEQGMTHDLVLSSLYGGVIFGIGCGLVYRGKGTSGGSDIIGMVLYHRLGISMTQAFMAAEVLVILASGFVWGWELALYGMIVIYVSSLAAEMTSEGRGWLRTALIITSQPDLVAEKIMTNLERGVTILNGKGAYTGAERPVLYCVLSRAEVNQVKEMVHDIDENAFMVIGQAHEALGEGFKIYQKNSM